ncbi:MAG TPA: AraC family transcriptional regulator [Stellaceae bacterium]|nr:AraC family transcriptional regulator [Stellaceae bacterium]
MVEASPFETLDHALRGGAIALVLLIAALLMRDHRRSLAARLGAAFAVGVAAYAVCSSHDFASHATPWEAPILALCLGNSVVFWLFARALFDDGFELRWWHAALWLAPIALGFVHVFILLPSDSPARRDAGFALALVPLVFATLAISQSLAGWRGDLVEGRRRVRSFVTGATAIYIVVIAITELALRGTPAPALMSTVNATGIVGLSVAIAWSLLRVEATDLFAARPPIETSRLADVMASPLSREPPNREADRNLLAELDRLMTIERAHRQEGLTIGTLALKLGIPEYRLRRVINQSLGYRNFTAFINQYRVDEATAALADPTQAEVPILTIAMDAGFQSLPPFNRAFKAETGMTPTAYRRLKLGGAAT